MKNKKLVLIILAVAGLLLSALLIFILMRNVSRERITVGETTGVQKASYYCPMHPNFTADKAGNCAICGMSLVKREVAKTQAQKVDKKTIKYYRNPMNPEVTSPVPMKDSMGMDYIPVYEEMMASEEGGIYISPERQQFVGFKTEIVKKMDLSRKLLTVGNVAYDPELYVAQEEYLQALKITQATKNSILASVTQQSNSLLMAAGKKLQLLGMSGAEIEELVKQGTAQENLYLPTKQDIVWVYMTIYEYEMGMIKNYLPVEVEAVAFPGQVFTGKIISLTPVLDPMTRSIQARAEINDPEHKLKPEMFVNVKIDIDLGKKLAVSEEAVINTGKRTIIVTTNNKGNFFSKDVVLGQKAEGFYEVLEGLKEGETVVTSGNFLIDSESRLQQAIGTEG